MSNLSGRRTPRNDNTRLPFINDALSEMRGRPSYAARWLGRRYSLSQERAELVAALAGFRTGAD